MNGSLQRLAIWVMILATWEAAYRLIGWPEHIFPAPSHVLDGLLGMLNINMGFGGSLRAGWPRVDGAPFFIRGKTLSDTLLFALPISGLRLLVGFALSFFLGGLLGLAMWRFKKLDEFLGPLFLGLQTLPSVCWVPLAILAFHLSEKGILFVLVMGSFFAIAISLRDGLRTIPPLYKQAGLMLGAHGWKLYRYVLLPASLPALSSSLRSGFSFAWRSLMGAELLYTFVDYHGVGYLLHMGREFNDVSQVIGVMIVMVGVGILVDRFIFARMEKKIYARFGLGSR
jgi:NitT/TauT family transport system permease protein